MLNKFKRVFSNKEIVKGLFITLCILFLYILGTRISIPFFDRDSILREFRMNRSQNDFMALFDAIGGGNLSILSVFGLGISPYITSSIVVQLLQMIIPRLKEMSESGDAGRQKIKTITKLLTIVVASVQAFAYLFSLNINPENLFSIDIACSYHGRFGLLYFLVVLILVAGAFSTMFLAEMITRYGIGNGSSLIIATGIVSKLPQNIMHMGSQVLGFPYAQPTGGKITLLAFVILLLLLMMLGVIFLEGAQRKIPVQYANREHSGKGEIPIKLNPANIMPVIFAQTLMMIPMTVVRLLEQKDSSSNAAKWINQIFDYKNPVGLALFTFLIFAFSFFYAFLEVDPEKISESLDRQGAFIPGFRRGEDTKDQLARIIFKTTLYGATYLCLLAMSPVLMSYFLKIFGVSSFDFSIGGTSLIILVGVAIETVRQIETASQTERYVGFLD